MFHSLRITLLLVVCFSQTAFVHSESLRAHVSMEADELSNIPLGGTCFVGLQCEGYIVPTGIASIMADGTDCCEGSCQKKAKDYAGNYWCPNLVKATTDLAVGKGCVIGTQCSGYTNSGEGVECCYFKCAEKVETNLLFTKLWACPIN